MKYNATMVYNKYDFIAITKAMLYQDEKTKERQKMTELFFTIFGIIAVFFGTLRVLQGLKIIILGGGVVETMDILLPALFIVMGFVLILGSESAKIGTNMWKQYEEKGSEIKLSFYDDFFTINTPKGEEKIKYSKIKNISEDRKRYFIFTGVNVGYIIRKSELNLDDTKEFGKFLINKTGLKINFN